MKLFNYKYSFLCLLVFLFWFKNAFAQFSHLLKIKNKIELNIAIHKLGHEYLKMDDKDSAYIAEKINEFKSFAQQNNNNELYLEALFFEIRNQNFKQYQKGNIDIEKYEILAAKCLSEKYYHLAARIYHNMGILYFNDLVNYELAFDSYYQMIALHKLLPNNEYDQKMNDNYRLAKSFYYFKDYKNAIHYCKQAILENNKVEKKQLTTDVVNTIGLCFLKTGNFDSALYYFNQVFFQNPSDSNNVWKGIVNGNIGEVAFLKKEYDKAIPLLQNCIEWAEKYGDKGLATGSLIPLAEIYIAKNKIEEARINLFKAKAYINENKTLVDRYEFLYPALAKYYIALNNQKLANMYLDSTVTIKNYINKKYNSLALLKAEQRQELYKRKAAIAQVEAEKESKTMQRNFLIVFIIVIMAIVVYIYTLIKKRHQQEKRLNASLLLNKENELKSATLQLANFSENISEKAKLIENFEQQLNLKQDKDQEILSELSQSVLLTDAQWDKFKKLFDTVYAGFLGRLKENYPEISPAETRYIVLSKIKFNNKEMAAALGVSDQSIRVTIHRLRKKLNLAEADSIADWVNLV